MKKKIFILLAVLLVILGVIFFLNNKTPKKNIFEDKTVKLYDEKNCKIKKEKFNVNGFSMQPMIKDKQEVNVSLNYYNCSKNLPKSGDIVIFENPHTLNRVIKKLSIVPGDKIEIDKEKKVIKINGTPFVNSAKIEYTFKESELNWFEIYTTDGIVKEGIYFIFGDNINGSFDSRSFGPITLEGLVGKVDNI